MINLPFFFLYKNDIVLENLKIIIEENTEMPDGQRVLHIKYRLPISLSLVKISIGHSNYIMTEMF